jgi:hypothetical protein
VRSAAASAVGRAGRSIASGAAWAWARRPPAPVVGALVFALSLAGASAAGIVFQARLASRLPSRLDWAAVAALLERDGRPGDAVVPSPAWAERVRALAPAGVPVIVAPDLAREDLVGVRRVWLVALPDAPGFSWKPELALLARSGVPDGPRRLGAAEVTLLALSAPALPLAFLPDRIAAAAVTVGDRGCSPEGATAFACPGAGAVRVAREVRDVGGAPRPCLVAAPNPEAGAPLALTFDAIPMGRAIRGHAAALGAGTAPVRLAVQIDGEEVGAVEIPAGAGWRQFQIDTTRHAGGIEPLAFVVTAAGPDAPPVCFDAVTLP